MAKLPKSLINKLSVVKVKAMQRGNYDILNLVDNLVYVPNLPAPAATDGKRVFIGDTLDNYSVESIYFIINHELDHIYYRHFARSDARSSFEHKLSNLATDVIINEILNTVDGLPYPSESELITRKNQEESFGIRIRGRDSNAVYQEMLAEVQRRFDEQEDEEDQDGEGQNGQQDEEQDGEGQSGQGGNQDDSDDGQDSSADEQESNKPSKNTSKGAGAGKAKSMEDILDEIIGEEELADMQQEELAREMAKKVAESLSEEEKEAIDKVVENIVAKQRIKNSEQAESNRNYKPPKIGWEQILRRYLGRHLKRQEGRNIRRPSNRYREVLPSQIVIPSVRAYVPAPRINVYLDTSGSMHGTIQNVRSILEEAERYFRKYKSKFHEFDYDIYEFSRADFYKRTGASGGTDIVKVIQHFEQDRAADLAVIITDAEDQFQKELDNVAKPVLVLTDNIDIETSNNRVTVFVTDFRD